MIYGFRAVIYTEGGRALIEIPFNVWEETGRKGNIPCRICIEDVSFECKLIPKGNGYYYIPINKNVLKQLNYQLLKKGSEEEAYAGMGTTTVAASEKDGKLYVVNVGDSRLYHIHDGEMKQITVDHSYVQELISAGVIDKEDGRNHPNKNVITRAVGAPQSLNVDHFIVPLSEGDYVILCSDGLHGMVEDEEIKEVVLGNGSIEEKTKELVRRAKQKGGKDNIAVILARMGNRGDELC